MTRTFLTLALTTALFTACGGKRPTNPAADAMAQAQADAQLPGAQLTEAQAAQAAAVAELLANFQRVHFETDSSMLTLDAKNALTDNASILREHPDLRVEVQGHADERGTVDYNLALGQRRARRVTGWLETNGVEPMRLRSVTYGEEFPLVDGHDEHAWSKNRRAEFRITAGRHAVVGTTE